MCVGERIGLHTSHQIFGSGGSNFLTIGVRQVAHPWYYPFQIMGHETCVYLKAIGA